MKKQTTKSYWKETIKNKIFAVLFILATSGPLLIDGDGTCMLFGLIVAIPLFFAKKNYIL